jgi:hypothetical protein
MARALSLDLRERGNRKGTILPPSGGAVWGERIECHPLGAQVRSGGALAPKSQGGDRRSQRIEAEAAFIVSAIAEQPDMTLAELQGKLKEGGKSFGLGTLWRFFQRHRITLKKNCPRRRAEPGRRKMRSRSLA